jgi:hexosaminidase
MKKILFSLLLCATAAGAGAQNLVPQPVSVARGEGVATMVPYRSITVTHNELEPLADYLAEHFPAWRIILTLDQPAPAAPVGTPSAPGTPAAAPAGRKPLPAEGYRLEVAPERITITGADYGGVWNGIQTLLQLCPAEIYIPGGLVSPPSLPVVTIEDWPAMPHRGVMLDVARTFVPVSEVKRLIDNISHHKINKLHWHLVDDEGWRIEIRALPRLTSVGAWRGGDSPVMPVYGAWDEKYGGFYTQDEIREVVAYAALRNVEIIPEIDLPGHSRAAAIAYPSILCDYTPSLTASAGYDTRNVWCVAREENYAMLDTIIGEVAALFPSPTMHLGGDEVETAQWKQCPHCKALMAARGITDAARLQDIFMSRAIDIAARHGKRAGVWSEAADGGRIGRTTANGKREATVWSWKNPATDARKYAANGYPTVVCAGEYFYFDMRQSARDIGHIWAGVVTLEKVYSFSPAAIGFTAAEGVNLRGVEATFFSELLLENGLDFLDYQLFPRVCALSEVAWTPVARRSWSDFEPRLRNHLARLDAMGVKYRVAEPQPTDTRPLKTPAVTFTSSLSAREKEPLSRVAKYSGAARTTTSCDTGDWFLWTFAAPLSASQIDLKTGYDHLQRGGVPLGRVEVSYDGRTFTPVATLHNLKARLSTTATHGKGEGTISPSQPIRALRIVSTARGNGESFVIIQPLKIR